MDGDAVREIKRLAETAAAAVVTIDGRQYATTGLEAPPAIKTDPIVFRSLDGFIDYVTTRARADAAILDLEEPSGLVRPPALDRLLVTVASPATVRLTAGLSHRGGRVELARAEYEHPEASLRLASPFNNWGPVEDAIIALQAMCVPTAARAALLKLLGSIDLEAQTTLDDDGTTQRVTMRAGVVLKRNDAVTANHELQPRWTFCEVDQPVVECVLRVRQGGAVCLFTADGGRWKIQAQLHVANYIRAAFDEGGFDYPVSC